MATTAKPRNPYIAGRALGQDRGFFGRADILNLVETVLSSPDNNAVVLFGQRRIGKTSILLQLQRRLPSPPFLPVYFDLMDRANRPMGAVLAELAATIAFTAGMPTPVSESFDDLGIYFRQNFLPTLYNTLSEEQRPLLLFDEFDVLDVAMEQQLPDNAAARKFFPYLRELMGREPRLGFVFVLGRKTEDMSTNALATFKAARYQKVFVLDDQEARELIRTAERQGTLRFIDDAVNRILALTSGHPYFTQLLCQLLWDETHRTAANDLPKVTARDVDATISKTLEAGQNIFEWVWDGLPPAERVIFAAVADGSDERQVITKNQINDILQQHGIRILTRELDLAPAKLVDWGMLRETAGGYGFFIEIMRRWVATNKPLARVKDELDRVVPFAETLYRSGEGFYRHHNLESAADLLRQALTANPNHLKARLLLGHVLLEQQNLEQAVRELEEAYRYDEDATRYPLVRTLLSYGEELERAQRETEAETIYQRVLVISPQEAVAPQRLRAILSSRGAQALAVQEFDTALQAYRAAKMPEKVKEVEAAKRRHELEQSVRAIQRFEQNEQWAEAAHQYQRLLALDPEHKDWQQALERVELEEALQKQYKRGQQALAQGQWARAIQILAGIVQTHVDYKGATALLQRALERYMPQASVSWSAIGSKEEWYDPALAYNITSLVELAPNEIMRLGRGLISEVAYAPNGKQVAVATRLGVWLYQTDFNDYGRLFPHPTIVSSVSWSPDGSKLASGLVDGTIQVWTVANGRLLNILQGHTRQVNSVRWSPDGSKLASGADDNTARLWDVAHGTSLAILDNDMDWVSSVSWSPDGTKIALCEGTTVRVWEEVGDKILTTLDSKSRVSSVNWSPDGSKLAFGSGDGTVLVWLEASNTLLFTLDSHRDKIDCVSWSPDGSKLASSSWDRTVQIWDVVNGTPLTTLNGHTDWVRSVSWSPDGSKIASGSWDKTIRIWEVASGTPLITLNGHTYPFYNVSWSPDGRQFASSSDDKTVQVWEAASGRLLNTLKGHTGSVFSVSWSPDGTKIASGSDDGTVRVWKAGSGKLLITLDSYMHSKDNESFHQIHNVSWSPDGNKIASGSSGDKVVSVWDVRNSKLLTTLDGHTGSVWSVSWSPDGTQIVSSSTDKTVRVWEVASSKLLHILDDHTDSVYSVSWSPDSSKIASGSKDKTVRVWEVASGMLLVTLQGHTDEVHSVSWSPDGSKLASSSWDKTVRLWEVTGSRSLTTLNCHTTGVRNVSWSPDGNKLASCSYDGTVRLWSVP